MQEDSINNTNFPILYNYSEKLRQRKSFSIANIKYTPPFFQIPKINLKKQNSLSIQQQKNQFVSTSKKKEISKSPQTLPSAKEKKREKARTRKPPNEIRSFNLLSYIYIPVQHSKLHACSI